MCGSYLRWASYKCPWIFQKIKIGCAAWRIELYFASFNFGVCLRIFCNCIINLLEMTSYGAFYSCYAPEGMDSSAVEHRVQQFCASQAWPERTMSVIWQWARGGWRQKLKWRITCPKISFKRQTLPTIKKWMIISEGKDRYPVLYLVRTHKSIYYLFYNELPLQV